MDAGCYRIVNVAGTTTVNGESDWKVKDWIIWNGVVWSKVDNTESVTAVNGLQGPVLLGVGELYDTAINAAAPNDILSFDGADWINKTLAGAGIPSLNDTTFTGTTTVANLTLNSLKVSLGFESGFTGQSSDAVAIGSEAGRINQGINGVAIGPFSGAGTQGADAIAIGIYAGNSLQKTTAVAFGAYAGQNNQGISSVALGNQLGRDNQNDYAIAIGSDAGNSGQLVNAIAIGRNA